MRLAFVVSLAAAALVGCREATRPHPLLGAGFTPLTYRTVGDVELRMFVLGPAGRPDSPRPLVLMFHGGGWTGGKPRELAPFCVALAREGFVAATAEYRLARRPNTVHDCVEDARAAYAFARSHAVELCADPDRVFLLGASAGGHLAYFACQEAPLPAGAVLLSAPADTSLPTCGRDLLGPRWRELSPLLNVTSSMPPLLLLHSPEDHLVPLPGVERLVARLNEAGVDAELVTEGVDRHGFYVVRDADELRARAWFGRILAFLAD